MIPRPKPIAPAVPDEPTEFERPHDFAKNYGGPREFARRTRGSTSEAGESRVITPDDTSSVGY